VVVNDTDLAELTLQALRQAEDERAHEHAEHDRLNAEAIRLYEAGYPYPPPAEHADPTTIEEARRLLDELDALRAQVRGAPGGKGAENIARAADEHARAFYRIMRDVRIPDDLVERARVVLDGIEAATGFALTRRA
jgi:hypothetical protein